MDMIAQHKVFHAGTYATNPLVMAAGLATFHDVLTPEGYAHIGKISDALVEGYKQIVKKNRIEGYVESAGANGALLFYTNKIRNLPRMADSRYRPLAALLVRHGEPRRDGRSPTGGTSSGRSRSHTRSPTSTGHLSAFEELAPAIAKAQQESSAEVIG